MAVKYKRPPALAGYNFPIERIKKARQEGRLLSLRVETSVACNLKCMYCNGDSGKINFREIPFGQIKKAILQAKSLGALSIVIIGGGEPTIYPHFKKLVKLINKERLLPVVFTNAQLLSPCLCKFLFDENASVLFKLDSLDETTQDKLCGQKGAFKKIFQGIENLFSVGFNKKSHGPLRCGASFVVTKLNFQGIPGIWKFCRENNVYPNFEQLVPRNRGLKNYSKLQISKKELNIIKRNLLAFDRKHYGYDWLVYSPLCGHGCWQPLYSMYLTSRGYLQPCADIAIKYYKLQTSSLEEIIKRPFFQLARNIDNRINGHCRKCHYKTRCIGCRGIAFSHGLNIGLTPEEALCQEDPYCALT
jgi:radical SAM protein with 4Fe4S-binding SPASM domain